jgi:hypothetical protein
MLRGIVEALIGIFALSIATLAMLRHHVPWGFAPHQHDKSLAYYGLLGLAALGGVAWVWGGILRMAKRPPAL